MSLRNQHFQNARGFAGEEFAWNRDGPRRPPKGPLGPKAHGRCPKGISTCQHILFALLLYKCHTSGHIICKSPVHSILLLRLCLFHTIFIISIKS